MTDPQQTKVEMIGRDFGLTPLAEKGHYAIMLPVEWLADDLVAEANQKRELPLYWVSRLTRHGVTEGLKRDVSLIVPQIHTTACFDLDVTTGTAGWKYYAPTDDSFPDEESIYALMVARLIGAGFVRNIRRCVATTAEDRKKRCPRFFVGHGRARWCSNTCGSRQRMRNARDQEKDADAKWKLNEEATK